MMKTKVIFWLDRMRWKITKRPLIYYVTFLVGTSPGWVEAEIKRPIRTVSDVKELGCEIRRDLKLSDQPVITGWWRMSRSRHE